jgi:type VI secretion system protein ImpK
MPSPPEAPPAVPESPLDEDTKEVTKKSILATLFKKRKKEPQVSATGTVVEGAPNFLFSKFRAFYNEIIRFKHQKSEFSAGFSTAIVTDYAADLTPDAAAEAQSKKLAEMLELQTAEASWMGGEALQYFPDAKYAMAALADELFMYMEWEGQEAWSRHLVETRLFHTHAADVEVFKRMDKLLKDRPNSPAARDMARVYLLILAAGFQGKWRPFELPRAIANYRQNLFEYIHSTDPLMIYAPERRIFPEAAERTLVGHAVARFSGAQRWAAILIFLVTAYTVVAHVAWNRVSADLKDVTARIRSGSTTAGGDVR